ncbi:MAG TPA: response regulator [Thermoanaerobaculia bacterium]|nr:response regulator [Thermoanaerobaculia bacterium]
MLVIDDSEDVRDLAAVILESDGFRVIVAETGRLGVEMAFAERPDLILLDVFMDGWSGEETLTKIRQTPGTEAIPVAFLTGETRPAERERLGRLGAVGIVTKPFTPATLITDVRALVAGGVAGAGPTVGDGLLDHSVLSQLQELADDDDPDFLVELVEAFINDASTTLASIESALRTEDRVLLARQSHILKSSSGNAGAAALSRAAQALESRTSDASQDELIELVSRLSSLLAPTSIALLTFTSRV